MVKSNSKIKVFISYQQKVDRNLRAYLCTKLEQELDNIEVLADNSVIQYSEDIHQKVSQSIDNCHCLIVPLSSMKSNEVVLELIQAKERGKEIIVISEKGISENEIGSHLDFLKGKLRITYSDFEDLSTELIEYFRDKNSSDFEILPSDFREIGKKLITNELHRKLGNGARFQKELINKILEEAKTEINNILDLDYTLDVGIERNFLIRAKSIFKNASKVYAISLDHVSTFWTQKIKIRARDYIDNQPTETVRLFVFSSPKVANLYREVLQTSHNSYGSRGAVLLCSLDSYKKFIRNYIINSRISDISKYLNQDFGLLLYEEEEEEEIVIEAFLDNSYLRFNQIDLDSVRNPMNYKKLTSDLDQMKELSPVEFHKDGQGEDEIIIKKWNPECLRNNYVWKEELYALFPKKRSGELYHFVCFSDQDNKYTDIVHQITTELKKRKSHLGISEIWLGRKPEECPVRDLQFQGQLKISGEYDYILFMKFDDYEKMIKYYENRQHSQLREKLYTKMDEGLAYIYEHLKTLKDNGKNDVIPKLFENVIEEIVSNYMTRFDFIDEESIDHIVEEEPIHLLY